MTVSSSMPSYQAWVELRPPLSILSVSFLPTRRRTPRGQPCGEREDRGRARVAGAGGGDRGRRLQREGVPHGPGEAGCEPETRQEKSFRLLGPNSPPKVT